MAGRELNHVYCVHCGTKNKIAEKDASGIKSCTKCRRQPVSMLALLTDVGLWGEEHGTCPACQHANVPLNTFCFVCGTKWREAQKS
jgi:NAD-dependent SIR2 family protein deacetylase